MINDDKDMAKTGILTDLYQLTMAQGYWKKGLSEKRVVFYSTFRRAPHNGGFTVFCGLETLSEFFENFGFSKEDTKYLSSLKNSDGTDLFDKGFLKYLESMHFGCDVFSVSEGCVVFPYAPLMRIEGPLVQCQIIETPLLNIINHQTLMATKAARVCLAAGDQRVLEFGFRRAHGQDGALSCSRAAYIGGCSATSNVLAGKKFGIPVMGTMAHSWVMLFDDEKDAFEAYADVSGSDFVLLVDTYDTLKGVENAVEVAKKMEKKGKHLAGVRLDSGDMAELSLKARRILDNSGFKKTKILASNDLDEYAIMALKKKGAPIDSWGVGTRLVTSHGHPALDGVYKLSGIENEKGIIEPRLKVSDNPVKNSLPGILQTRRYKKNGFYSADIIHDINQFEIYPEKAVTIENMTWVETDDMEFHDELLKKVFASGSRAFEVQDMHSIRSHAADEIARLKLEITDLTKPGKYPVGMEKHLADLKNKLTTKYKGNW